jgi:hypothetical protein
MTQTRARGFGFFFILTLAMSMAAFGSNPNAGTTNDPASVGDMNVSASAIQWSASGNYERLVLTVSGPENFSFTKEFESGRVPTLRLVDLGKVAVDGGYSWQLRIVPRVSPDTKRLLAAAREAGDEEAAVRIQAAAGLNRDFMHSGAFTIQSGAFVGNSGSEPATPGSRKVVSNALKPAPEDQVYADDVIIQGSACVGLDCVNNESFGFDTIRLKENNTRIKFDDTSSSAGFPANDWQLTANDSASGGSSKFSIEDITGSKVPFTVTAGAATNSIFVDSTGRLGLRTSTPVLDVHVNTGNTPAIRLEQNNSAGFTAQTWDIGANEANFFIRDVTGGSKLSLRIRPGAPTSSVDISANGDVGMGTASPSEKLHVFENVNENTFAVVENSNTGTSAVGAVRAKSDTATVNFQAHASTRVISRWGQVLGGWTEMLMVGGNGLAIGTNTATPLILGTNALARLTIDSSGNITVPGNFTVTGVKNFATLDPADSKKALYYTALEGPEAGTYFRGTAKTVNGEVVIELPGYFARLTESERMTVQLTPVGTWGQIYVASKSPEKLVIKVAEGSKDLEFDYLVQGVRKGYLDYEVERTGAFPVQK